MPREQVKEAVKDPAQNAFITSEYLGQLKAESSFADVRAEAMTPARYQELAARYSGGPYGESNDAQAYGRGFVNKLHHARQAMQSEPSTQRTTSGRPLGEGHPPRVG